MLKAEHKVEGGKLIKVQLSIDNGKIKEIKIMGDFFMHPEEAIENLEKSLVGCAFDKLTITENIKTFIKTNSVTLLGVSPEDFTKCIMKAGGGNG
ncbi:MAG: lipoate protein ligase C-terminal domain-containing protein [Candidatus Bathyarchaeia archaeon]